MLTEIAVIGFGAPFGIAGKHPRIASVAIFAVLIIMAIHSLANVQEPVDVTRETLEERKECLIEEGSGATEPASFALVVSVQTIHSIGSFIPPHMACNTHYMKLVAYA